MIRNYLIIAFRNIRRNLSYSLINITGLSLGITCSLVLFLMVSFVTSFDDYHPNGDRVYRIVHSWNHMGREEKGAGVPVPFPDDVRSKVTGLQHVLFICEKGGALVTIENNGERRMFEEKGGLGYTDSLYFAFFHQPLIAGKASLVAPNEAVISETLAKRYFGDEEAVGKTIRLDNSTDVTVTGVMEDHPENTSFPFQMLISYQTVRAEREARGWGNTDSGDQCYVMLSEGTGVEAVNQQFSPIITDHFGKEQASEMNYWLEPLREIHYDTDFSNYAYKVNSKDSIWAMVLIAIFLLITSSINFINLTTAVAVKRSREVGVRKVLGSQRSQLIFQYLSETGIITFFSLLISVGLAELGLLKLNAFMDMKLHIHPGDWNIIVLLLGLWAGISLASGLYPAFLLSGFNPIAAFRNNMSNRNTGGYVLRRGLIIMQFVISQFLIIGTVVMIMQMDYFRSKDMGFTKEAIITVPLPHEANATVNKNNLKDRISQLQGVSQVSLCNNPPAIWSISSTNFSVQGIEGNYVTQLKTVDADYIDLFNIQLVAGHNFAESDSITGWVVNEKLVKAVGLKTPEEIIGRTFKMWGKELPVVGVVKDFHTASLQVAIEPTTLFSFPGNYNMLAIKLEPGKLNTTIREIEKVWSATYPEFLFNHIFVDDTIKGFYEETWRMSVMLIIFSCIAIVIGCLGLYGLVSFMASQKQKEVGVRKVLGATTGQIVMIFSKEFVLLIIIAFIIASPLAGYVMNLWLEQIVYRIDLGWPMFLTGILATLLVAFLTVGYRSLRAATANPVDSLRSE